jgi:glycosyltransferase involved in cell wall biosynthesis
MNAPAAPADAGEISSNLVKPVKVLHFICSTGFYGAEKWILALANNADAGLVDSELVVTRESVDHDLELTREFKRLGLPAHELPMNGRFDFRVVSQLVKLIRQRGIEVIHCHGYKSDIIGVIAGRIAGVKCISTPHGFETTVDWKLNLFIKLGCVSLRFFDFVVPLSPELESDVRGMKVSDKKIRYIRNAVDLKGIEFRGARKDASGAKKIGFIGQMIERKNVRDLLDVFDAVAQDTTDVSLCLLGDGASRAEYEAYAAGLASADAIEFTGFVNNPLEYLKTFDLFVMSSQLEGIPRCLMESMAMGVPVAAYDIPGIDQLIEHKATGLLAPFGDKRALEACWRELLGDAALSEQIAIAAHNRINRLYSASRMAREYTELYQEICR